MNNNHSIYLTKIEPNTNQYRYYCLRIDPDLFGRWSLFRQWGRLNTDGGSLLVNSFDTEDEAIQKLSILTAQKKKRGYHVSR